MRATVTLVFVLVLSLVVWRGQGLAQSPLVELEAGLSHGVHPAVLALVKPGEAIHVSPAAFAVQAYGSGQLVTFSGVEFEPATIDLCERSKRRADRPAEFYPLHIGLSASELEALLNQRDFRLLDSNLMDSPEQDFPRLRISSASHGFNLEQQAGQYRVVTDSHLMNQFKRIAVVADEQAESLLLIQHVKKANCALGEFRVRNFQLDDSPKKKWFAIISADQDVKPVTGDVQAGDYFRDYEQLDGVSALATAALECGAVHQEAEGEPVMVASRYQMTDLPAINRNPNFVSNSHCRGVLKALYSTNNGTLVRQRVKRLNQVQAPLVAFKTAEPEKLLVTRVANGAPLSPVTGVLPGGREALLYTNPNETTGGWLQGDEAIELSAAVTKPVSLYVVGNAQVQQGEVITRQNLCIKRLCEEGDVELLLLKPSAHGRIQLTIQPLATKPFLLQEQTTRLDAPQTAAEKMPLTLPVATVNRELYAVVDRKGVSLDEYAIPQLVGRWTGAPIPLEASEPRAITLDLAFHQQVQEQLSEFVKTLPEQAQRQASFSVANANGELLALAQWPQVSPGQNLERLAFISQTNPATSPLTLQAAYHNGAQQNVSGSVFKLVSALYIADLLPERTRKTLAAWQAGEHQEQGFDPYARCYPFIKLACAKGAINIFSHQGMALTLANRMQRYGDASYGVAEAIRDSNNTYFAWGVEQALPSPLIAQNYIAAQSLGQGDVLNPVLNLADQLGFRHQLTIPGSSSRSEFGSINSRAKLWRFAVGEQNKVTALHVLQMTLAIAKGGFQPLGVLLGEQGTAQALPISEQAFAEVRHGMAMAAASYGALKPYLPALADAGISLYAKTGTGSFVAVGEDAAERTLHNTYLTGYLHSVQSQPLVFTCRISHVDQLAGEVCGALVARLMPLLVSQFDPSLLLLFPAVSEVSLNPLGV